MDRGAWRATVHRVTKNQTRLKQLGNSVDWDLLNFILNLIFILYYLIYNVVLVSGLQQSDSVICMYVSVFSQSAVSHSL